MLAAADPQVIARVLADLQQDPFCPVDEYAEIYGPLELLPSEQQQELINTLERCDVCSLWYTTEDPCPYH